MKSSSQQKQGLRIIFAGTGGQGALTAARLLCEAFVDRGHQVVSGQLHGMAQRGGSVQSSVLIDCGISPVIPQGRADFVVGFEPVETARALPYMSANSVVYMNTTPVVPFVIGQQSVLQKKEIKYPDPGHLADSIQSVTKHLFTFDATQMAAEAGSIKTLNVVMLGALLSSGSLPCTANEFWETATKTMPPRLAETNTKAFFCGVEVGKQFMTP